MKRVTQIIIGMLLVHVVTFGALTGTKIISATGGDYPTVTAAIAALNSQGVGNGGVEFVLNSDETYVVNPADSLVITTTGATTKPVKFRSRNSSQKALLNISGAGYSKSSGIRIDGGDYFTFEDIKLNCDTSIVNGFYLTGSSVNKGANNITIKNCEITLSKSHTFGSKGIIIEYSSSPSDSASACKRNIFQNNLIKNCDLGIKLENKSISNLTYDLDNKINGNTISGFTMHGIYVAGQKRGIISGNIVSGLHGSGSDKTLFSGICLSGYYNTVDVFDNKISDLQIKGFSVCGILVTQGTMMTTPLAYNIYNNKIQGITNSGDSCVVNSITYRSQAQGINVDAANSINNIYNNQIYNITAPNSAVPSAAVGINVAASKTTCRIFYNTVYLTGTGNVKYNTYSCLYVSSLATSVDLRNNIFINHSTPGTGSISVVFDKIGNFKNIASTSNNNLYLAKNDNTYSWIFFPSSFNPALNYQDIAVYKAAANYNGVKFDQNAISEMPLFNSTGEIIDLTLKSQLSAYAAPVTSPVVIDKDYNGFTRNPNQPTIGALEFGTVSTINQQNEIKCLNLLSCYPNPFNPETTVCYNLNRDEAVKLTIYNAAGQQVRELFSGRPGVGMHTSKFNAVGLNSGVYFVAVKAGTTNLTQKIVLAK